VDRVALDELRQRLPADTALLAYWVHPRRTFLWVVRAHGVQTIQIPVAASTLEEATQRYLAPIRDRTVAADVALRGEAAQHLATGAELQRLLVAPAAAHIAGAERLVVVPDAFLWYLPFEALVTEAGTGAAPQPAPFFWEYMQARYLADAYRVVYAPSATAWVRLAAAGRNGRGFVSLAPAASALRARGVPRGLPPLPSSRAESAALAALFAPAQTLADADASEAGFRTAAEGARFIHVAAHGYLHRAQPDLSGVFLAPGGTASEAGGVPGADDGLLQAHEIKRLRYRSELVSLATCNSALGQFSRGEGLLGIGRAFLTSGARNVLVSLWRVNDAAGAQLMQRFYSGVARGQSLSGALQGAKRSLRGEVHRGTIVLGNEAIAYAHPYFWAGFVAIGADSASP
jgi:CHAT domain-containing protein